MLLTNTIQANTNNTTVVNGNVICGVVLRGCSVCPEHSAEQPIPKRAAKRIAKRLARAAMRRNSVAGIDVMYACDHLSWHQSWLSSSTSHRSTSRLLLGSGSGRSLN